MKIFKFIFSGWRKKLEKRYDNVQMMVKAPILRKCEGRLEVIEKQLISAANLFNHVMNFNLSCEQFELLCKVFRVKVLAYEEMYDYYLSCQQGQDRTIRNYHLLKPDGTNVGMHEYCNNDYSKTFTFLYDLKRPSISMNINDLVDVYQDLSYVSSCLDICLYASRGLTSLSDVQIDAYLRGLNYFYKEGDTKVFNSLGIPDPIKGELIRIIKLNIEHMDKVGFKATLDSLSDKL